MTEPYDLIVIGLGVGGIEVASQAAAGGLAVAAIEQNLVGGECPYWGCIPSKVMVRAADTLAEAARVDQLAGHAQIAPEWAVVARRLRDTTEGWSDASAAKRLREGGVNLIRGQASILGRNEVMVKGRLLTAARGLVIASGTQPAIPTIDGIDDVAYWTNREAIQAEQLPRSLLVLGGGAVGLELAQSFRRFGVGVTIVEAEDHLLPLEEPENGEAMAEILRAETIDVHTGATCVSVGQTSSGIVAELTSGAAVHAERLLVATGRRADLRRLGVEALGLDADAAAIATDERLRAADDVWAVGDITGHGAFTHVAYYQAQIAVADILHRDHPPADYSAVPRVTFTDPEVAGVGMTEAQARATGRDVRIGVLPTVSSDRGWLHGPGGEKGFVKLVADASTGQLLGGAVMAPSAGEVIGFIGLAIRAHVPIATLEDFIYPYPTFVRGVKGAIRRLAPPLRTEPAHGAAV
jgi:pyruvate/2-oxoglutarate dehydrogenase complex dihydrolipoamide dehydrogenase (E3) component